MKKTVLKTLAVLVLGLSFASCTKKSTTTPTTPASTTPAFSATIGSTATTFSTTPANLDASDLTITETATNYTISVYLPVPVSTGTQPIVAAGSSGAYVILQTPSGGFSSSTSGSITISSYNTTNKTISGTFNCALSGNAGTSITNGSFANISF
jgi:hypothetical protein